ncbi:hypothetical protein HMPREF1987_02262 [Peptostreptococcaceae bacterium oral taxon 113 str. W5053]|nr:hypothetical protein HMPREF1987_02262 [Peptostreptococcaceae bacterium oral taxon 113 str. W5053]
MGTIKVRKDVIPMGNENNHYKENSILAVGVLFSKRGTRFI